VTASARTLAVSVLALAPACLADLPDVVLEGARVDFVYDASLEPCGDVVGHMDRFVELAAQHLGIALADHRFTFRWFPDARFLTDSGCTELAKGCAYVGEAHARVAPIDHELVHLLSFVADGGDRPNSFFIEGLAVALELPDKPSRDVSPVGDEDVLASMIVPKLDGEYYPLAGAFTRFVIDRHGMDAYMRFYVAMEWGAALPDIEAAYREAFGEELRDAVAIFDAERRECTAGKFRFKLRECADEPQAWDDREFVLARSLSCDDPDVVGPFADATARMFVGLEVAQEGLFELSTAAIGGGAATFGSCGGCEVGVHERVEAGERRRVSLPAGRYYVQLEGPVGSVTELAFRLARVDGG
jgi:hypothetical protein